MVTIKERTVIVTGSSKGLGEELAYKFSEEDNVVINGRDAVALKKVYDNIKFMRNKKCKQVIGDITKKQTIEDIENIANICGVDILINNAGIYNYSENPTEKELREIFEVNFFAPVKLTSKLLPIFIKQGHGLIININSIAGKKGSIGEAAYSASKHALKGYFDSIRYSVTKQGIRIVDVYLGAMKTEMTNEREDRNLLIRPEEVARLIVNNSKLYGSLSLNEINIGRLKYAN